MTKDRLGPPSDQDPLREEARKPYEVTSNGERLFTHVYNKYGPKLENYPEALDPKSRNEMGRIFQSYVLFFPLNPAGVTYDEKITALLYHGFTYDNPAARKGRGWGIQYTHKNGEDLYRSAFEKLKSFLSTHRPVLKNE